MSGKVLKRHLNCSWVHYSRPRSLTLTRRWGSLRTDLILFSSQEPTGKRPPICPVSGPQADRKWLHMWLRHHFAFTVSHLAHVRFDLCLFCLYLIISHVLWSFFSLFLIIFCVFVVIFPRFNNSFWLSGSDIVLFQKYLFISISFKSFFFFFYCICLCVFFLLSQ